MFLHSSVSILDMVKHLLSLHYLYVISMVRSLLKKHILKASFFLGEVKRQGQYE